MLQALPEPLEGGRERPKTLSAAVCNCNPTATDRILPSHAIVSPSASSRTMPGPLSKRAAEEAEASSAAVCSYNPAEPRLTLPGSAVPNSG
jgi:hypothetical protein